MKFIGLFFFLLQLLLYAYLPPIAASNNTHSVIQMNLSTRGKRRSVSSEIYERTEFIITSTISISNVLHEDNYLRPNFTNLPHLEGSNTENTQIMYRNHRFEGDIVLMNNTKIQDNTVTSNNSSFQSRCDNNHTMAAAIQYNAARQKTLLWPGGRIPYTISPDYSNVSRLIISEAFEEYQRWTCVRFVPKQPFDSDFIDIKRGDGCYSMVGNNGGKQTVSLGDGCLKKGIAIHEMMHVLGFFHEQSRADRDLYVDIHWENVDPTLVDQFDKYSTTMIDDLGVPYDYGSIMHYAPTAFSKNGELTITPKAGSEHIEIGQRRGFSNLDIWKINKLYNCTDYLQLTTSTVSKSFSRIRKKRKRTRKRPEGKVSGRMQNQLSTATTPTVPSETRPSILTGISDYPATTTITTHNGTQKKSTSAELKINLNLPTLPALQKPIIVIDLSSLLKLFGTPPPIIQPLIKTTVATTTTITEATVIDYPLPTMEQCRDRHSACQILKARGFCASNPHFMNEYCMHTCGRCIVGCKDRAQWCNTWMRAGMCTNKPLAHFMNSNCAQSCAKC